MRGVLVILLILAAGASYAAPAPNNAAQPKQSNPASRAEQALGAIASAQNRIAEATNTGEYQQPCDDGEYDNRSDLCAQWYAARSARDAANSAYWAVFWTVVALGLNAVGLALLLLTIRQGQKTYRAFIRVEDASLVVEFPNANLIETIVEGVKQPDTYFFEVVITNIGRSTARIHGWDGDDGKPERHEHTLGAGASWAPEDHIPFTPQDGYFTFALHYSSPLHEGLILEVGAKVKGTLQPNGATRHVGLVKSTRFRRRDRRGQSAT